MLKKENVAVKILEQQNIALQAEVRNLVSSSKGLAWRMDIERTITDFVRQLRARAEWAARTRTLGTS